MRRSIALLITGVLLAAAPVLADDEPVAAEAAATDEAAKKEGAHAKERKQQKGNQRGGKSAEARMQGFMDRLLVDIELSDAQQQSLEELQKGFLADVDAHQAEIKSLRAQMKAARDAGETEKIEEYGAELRASRKESPKQISWIDELRDILTPEQQQQFDTNREKIQRESKGRKGRQRKQ